MKNKNESPVLIGQSGQLNGQRWTVEREITIGRDSTCELMIPDRQVSRFHARIANGEKVTLEDLGSKNGTFRNGQRISESVVLQDGDMIQIALIQNFIFLNSDATLPLYEKSLTPATDGKKGKLVLDLRGRRVWIGDQEVVPPLSVPQFRLLQILYDQQGKVIARQEIVQLVWEGEEALGVSEQAFDALVRRLRARLAAVDQTNNYIVTIRGHGLRLNNPQV